MAKFFFYGTLLDEDVRAAVIGRALSPDAIVPVRLAGFRAARAQGRAYPVLAPQDGGWVEGIVVRGLSLLETARLFHYEDVGYEPVTVEAARGDGRPILAWVFMPGRRLAAMDEDWTLAAWTRRHKRRVMPTIRAWMKRFPGACRVRTYRTWLSRRRTSPQGT
jgi:hypothetical protein